jgi:hypothetical protein
MKMPVPTEEEWGDYKADLDANAAHRQFAGKSNDDVQIEFERNVIERTDELRWMPKVPFQYYMLGFKQFIESRAEQCDDRSDAASCFIRLVEEKLENIPVFILPILDQLMPTVKYVAENQNRFDADKSIYGNFFEIYENIVNLMQAL